MNDNISDKDKKDWDSFINSEEKLPNKDIHSKDKKTFNVRSIDLHGYTLDQANKTINEFINKAYADKVKKLIVITGKGKHSKNDKDIYTSKDFGRLKYSVPEFINSDHELSSLIVSIQDAKIKDGGEGAIIIKLKSL